MTGHNPDDNMATARVEHKKMSNQRFQHCFWNNLDLCSTYITYQWKQSPAARLPQAVFSDLLLLREHAAERQEAAEVLVTGCQIHCPHGVHNHS